MKQLFRSQYKITQAFGVNYDYYKQFELKGHEGIDLIPTGTVWDVLCLADGVVVTDVDNPLSGAYGVYVTVWHPKLRKATQYCHFKENYVKNGDTVTAGTKLGLMGKTGNTKGAHVHLNLFEVDDNGVRLNRNNGFQGGIDPLPFLEEDTPVENTMLEGEFTKCRTDRDQHWNDLNAIKDALVITGDYVLKLVLDRIESLLSTEREFGKQAEALRIANEKITELEKKLSELEPKHEEIVQDVALQGQDIQEVKDGVQEVKDVLKKPDWSAWKLIWEGIKTFFIRK